MLGPEQGYKTMTTQEHHGIRINLDIPWKLVEVIQQNQTLYVARMQAINAQSPRQQRVIVINEPEEEINVPHQGYDALPRHPSQFNEGYGVLLDEPEHSTFYDLTQFSAGTVIGFHQHALAVAGDFKRDPIGFTLKVRAGTIKLTTATLRFIYDTVQDGLYRATNGEYGSSGSHERQLIRQEKLNKALQELDTWLYQQTTLYHENPFAAGFFTGEASLPLVMGGLGGRVFAEIAELASMNTISKFDSVVGEGTSLARCHQALFHNKPPLLAQRYMESFEAGTAVYGEITPGTYYTVIREEALKNGQMQLGEFFSTFPPGNRLEAETLYNIRKWGNFGDRLVTVEIERPGLKGWRGNVAAGMGRQVIIQKVDQSAFLKIKDITRLPPGDPNWLINEYMSRINHSLK